ncbi:hypothetical protein [Mesorhizobium sp.]|uniref:hypothetical protein n=1 Tax=Mesorhizobium sp. TaxID=1871066 RepID=UPI0025BDA653|nr:hypothetical protein [Mesorhizobium sp.]
MSAAEFIDKVLTPVGGGVGVFLAFRWSPQLKTQPMSVALLGAVSVALILAALKWLA